MDFSGIMNLAASGSVSYWISLGINLILSTLVGGILVVILTYLLAREASRLGNAFLMVLIINLINLFGILGFLAPSSFFLGMLLPVLVWIFLVKVFLGATWTHSLIIGILGWLLSIFLVPWITSLILPLIPL
ncbi:MAG: hypothetical protein DRP12_03650 [Candidatus Aenigmatarchaeota archaeon]|nr:MAG: hypothetical protein DRP12_03650 [Candidatus Aenigmarchaeota archaeon]